MRIVRVQLQQKIPIIGLMIYSSLLLIGALIAIDSGRTHSGWQFQAFAVQAVWIILYLAATFFYFRSSYLFSTAYLLALLLFHLGLFWQYALGAVSIPGWNGGFGKWIYQAIWYTTLAMASFGCGLSALCLIRSNVAVPSKQAPTPLATVNLDKLRQIGTGLFIVSACLLLITIIQLGNILKLSRFDLFFRNDTRTIGVFVMIFPSAVLILFITAKTARQRLQSYIFTGFAFLLILLSGSRSTALFPALTGLIIWAKLGRRIPAALLVGGITFVLLAIPVIGYIRDSTYEKISLEAIAKTSERTNIGSALTELGGTVGVLAHTVKIIPEEEPFRYGYSYLIPFRQLIPNFGDEVNATYSRRSLKQQIDSRGKDALFDFRPSDWASYHIIPLMFLDNAGTGFSAIGEAYFNFGTAGVIVIFALIGALLARFDSVLLAQHYRSLVFATLFFCHFLLTVRNDFGNFIKPSEYTAIVVIAWLLLKRFLPKLNKKSAPKLQLSQLK